MLWVPWSMDATQRRFPLIALLLRLFKSHQPQANLVSTKCSEGEVSTHEADQPGCSSTTMLS